MMVMTLVTVAVIVAVVTLVVVIVAVIADDNEPGSWFALCLPRQRASGRPD
jgi:hypothetical protein